MLVDIFVFCMVSSVIMDHSVHYNVYCFSRPFIYLVTFADRTTVSTTMNFSKVICLVLASATSAVSAATIRGDAEQSSFSSDADGNANFRLRGTELDALVSLSAVPGAFSKVSMCIASLFRNHIQPLLPWIRSNKCLYLVLHPGVLFSRCCQSC